MALFLKNNTKQLIAVDNFELDPETFIELDENDLVGILTDALKNLLLSGSLTVSNNKEIFATNFSSWLAIDKLTTKTQFRSPVTSRTELPMFGSEKGDVRITLADGGLYWYTGASWETLVSSSYKNYDGTGQANNINKMIFVSPETQIYTDFSTYTTYVGVPKEPNNIHNNNLIVQNQQYTGRVSQGEFYLKTGLVPGAIIHNIIPTSDPLVITTPENMADGDKGQVKLRVNGNVVSSIDLKANYLKGPIEQNINNYSSTGLGSVITAGVATLPYGTFNIEYVKQHQGFFLYEVWKAKIVITKFNGIRSGYNYIDIIHELDIPTNDGIKHETRTSNICEFFIDLKTRPIEISNFTMEATSPIYRYLSGVRYYDAGTVWKLKAKIDGAFNLTYPVDEIPITLSNWPAMPVTNVALSKLPVQNPPLYDSIVNLTAYTIEQGENAFTNNARVTANINNIYNKEQKYQSNSDNIHVCSYVNTSTDLSEQFYEERYRMPVQDYNDIPTGVVGKWKSNEAINVMSRTDWYGLQVYPGKLIYPSKSFANSMLPNGNPNYTNLKGDLSYYRAFKGTKISRSQGTLRVRGITAQDVLQNKIKIEIKLPGQTGWLLLNKDYNYTSFTGKDGDGCWINSLDQSDSDFQFTLDKYRTEGSNFILIVKITMYNTYKNFEITRLEITDW